MRAEMVAFTAPKQASSAWDWEDGVRFDEGFGPGRARFIVADGATNAFDAIRWVGMLVESFVPPANGHGTVPCPELEPGPMQAWFESLQKRWADEAPTNFQFQYEADKFKRGSFATMLGCELVDLSRGDSARWRAASVGDAVMFHVREGRLRAMFPSLRAEDFGNRPASVHTDPRRLDRMAESLRFSDGELATGDHMFVTTDALGRWVVETAAKEDTVWGVLATVDEQRFRRLIDDRRKAGELKDDDVTLLRVHLSDESSPLMEEP